MLYEAEKGDITMALAGDALIHRPLSMYREERFLKLVELLRGADATYANLEVVVHQYEGYPTWRTGYSGCACHPQYLEDLKWAGIRIMSCANNHSYDWGERGVLSTLDYLEAAGIPNAGMGRNLREALAPGYLHTPAGRVALLSVTSTFSVNQRAGDQRPDMLGRPGSNDLRWSTIYRVDRQAFQELRRISQGIGLEDEKAWNTRHGIAGSTPQDTDTEFNFLGQKYVLAEQFAVGTKANAKDLANNTRWIASAARLADWVVMSFHHHEHGATQEEPADFGREFARACIDAGAHVVAGHGPHFLRGVEIYKGRPIFYSLGNFIFQLESIPWHAADAYEKLGLGYDALPTDYYNALTAGETLRYSAPFFWQSAVATCDWRGGRLKEIRLYPIDLGHKKPWGQRGRPLLADGELARQILADLQRLSRPFGTEIAIEGQVGVIRP